MPPEERFVPRFAAEPPLEELPYGRWAERLSAEFLGACLKLDTEEEDLGEPGEIRWYPDRTWNGRTYVPGTSITANGYELFGHSASSPRPRAATRATSPRRWTSPRRRPRAIPIGSSTSAMR